MNALKGKNENKFFLLNLPTEMSKIKQIFNSRKVFHTETQNSKIKERENNGPTAT